MMQMIMMPDKADSDADEGDYDNESSRNDVGDNE